MDKFVKKEYWVIRDGDLETLIRDHTGLSFQIAASFELNNGTLYAVEVSGEWADWDAQSFEALSKKKAGTRYPDDLDLVMLYLCHLGVIQPGSYLIDIYW